MANQQDPSEPHSEPDTESSSSANPFQSPAGITTDDSPSPRASGPSHNTALQGCLLFWLFLTSLMGAVMVFLVTCFGTGAMLMDSGNETFALTVAILVGSSLGVGAFAAAIIGIGRQTKRRRR